MIRRLNKEEHRRTRAVWKEIFSEDSKEFLDYYYAEITRQNEIYVIEEKTEKKTGTKNTELEIRAMLHLNPFIIRAGAYCGKLNYIVAVATRKPYRGRGYMAELLKASCQAMYQEQQPFTFLMPAAEAIYYPHGFRFIYQQKRGWITVENRRPEIICEPMTENESYEVAELAERLLADQDVYTRRSESYYRRLLKEQASENGGVLLLKEAGELKGILCYASEGDQVEMREPLIDAPPTEWEMWLSQAAYVLTGKPGSKVFCEGYGEEESKPAIMARVVCLPAFFACFTANENVEETIMVSDPMLAENNGTWQISAKKGQPLRAVNVETDTKETSGIIRAAQLVDEAIPVSLLMACLSGSQSVEEAAEAERVVLPEAAKKLLKKIRPWKKVFINEIV